MTTAMIASPFEQFEIVPLLSLGTLFQNFALTNSSVFSFIVLAAVAGLFSFGTKEATIVPNRWQTLVEQAYAVVADVVQSSVGPRGAAYFPWMFSTFVMIAGANVVGLIPYAFTVTSHLAVTMGFGLATFIGINIVAFREHGLHFFSFFVPKDVPVALLPLLCVIEVISYIFRVISLSVRLFANMMAGHALLKILAGFVWQLLALGGIFSLAGLFPFVAMMGVTVLELGVALLQAYVWTVLCCIYLNDAIHLH
uniref:ATP synthase subunit a n=1 Tax=Hemiarma marina TaxID=1848298 RepID=A0A679EJQ4_9CRYP|nr:ATP synthase F0 subunit 6 [Hemiarma marina]